MKKWQYKVWVRNNDIYPADDEDTEDTLNSIGDLGWELVSVAPQVAGSGDADGVTVNIGCNVFIFKRAIAN